MKFLNILIVATLAIWTNSAAATPTETYILCIQSGGANCGSDGFDANSYQTDNFVFAQGFNEPGDPGGGTFVNMGICPSPSPANGGTIVQDHSMPNPYCFRRLQPNWGPKEFGAVGTGSRTTLTDDSKPLKAWLNAVQPHIGDADTYGTSKSLTCGNNTTVQGPENLDGSSGPLFQIIATHELGSLSANVPVIDARDHCRLSGVAVNANNDGEYGVLPTVYTDAVWADGYHVTIDGFSLLENGAYDLSCPSNGGNNNALNVRDTLFNRASISNFYAAPFTCGNIKLIGDIFTGATGTAVVFGADEMILANGTIEAAGGIGLDLTGANKVSVTGMNIDANGQLQTSGQGLGAGIKIKDANTISICGNHIEGNGGVDANYSSQIYFGETNDNIDFCGNTYETKPKTDVTLRPSYVYDVANGTVLTNSHFYESAPPQAAGAVYSPGAAAILPQLQVPHIVQNEISGLVLSNDGTTLTKVDVTPGEAADSTNSAVIQLPTGGCNVDLALANHGPGGLDTGSIATTTTYFYFLIGSASGGGPACMASASTVPTFVHAGAAYQTGITGSTMGTTLLYNVSSVAGLAVGQMITAADIPSGTTISNIGTVTVRPAGVATISTSGGITTVTVPSTAGMAAGMAVSDYLLYAACAGGTTAGLLDAGDTQFHLPLVPLRPPLSSFPRRWRGAQRTTASRCRAVTRLRFPPAQREAIWANQSPFTMICTA